MIDFLLKKVYRTDLQEWLTEESTVIRKAELEESEIIIVYKMGKYHGYINLAPWEEMLPEQEPFFEPQELEFDDTFFEKAYTLFGCCDKLNLIPLCIDCNTEELMLFAHRRKYDNECESWLHTINTYSSTGSNKKLFINKLLGNKQFVVLPELDEFSYKCYQILKENGIGIRTEGILWRLMHINTNNYDELVPDNKVLYMRSREVLGRAVYYVHQMDIFRVKNELQKKRIRVYTVSVPSHDRLDELSMEEEIVLKAGLNYSEVNGNIKSNLSRYYSEHFLNLDKIDGLSAESNVEETIVSQNAKATIYLIGPCIVTGLKGFEQYSLMSALYQRLMAEGLKYKVQGIFSSSGALDLMEVVNELSVTDRDILFMIETNLDIIDEKNTDINLLALYNKRDKNKLFFTDHTMHTLYVGNVAIADVLMAYIPEISDDKMAKQYLQVGTPRLGYREKELLQEYIGKVRISKEKCKQGTMGAIVINGNPFTKGHLYLIESAARQVDRLYVMVVEEDLSEFRFEDRFRLIKDGTKHLRNVSVVPSGSLVLSRQTMSAYFEKEEWQQYHVDASRDVALFGAYVAPLLSIGVRFVGEEPLDAVTRQYNEEMKEKLPVYGVKVVEIPRLHCGENIISASLVRKLYEEKEWKRIEELVPEVTVNFLKAGPQFRNKKELLKIGWKAGES